MPSACELFACLLFRNKAVPLGIYPRQACWPLKLQSLNLAHCKNSQKSASLIFPANDFGEVFSSCGPLCDPLSWLSLWPQVPPLCCTHDLFLPQTISSHFLPYLMWLLTSLYLWSLFCQSSGWFGGYLEWFDSYSVVLKGWDEPKVLLVCCHLLLAFVWWANTNRVSQRKWRIK